MTDDLARAREYGDAFRKYLLAALTGGVGVTLTVAGSLAGKGVAPSWATPPILVFCLGLFIVGGGLLMGEHRSLLRRRDANAQAKLPFYKTGTFWNLLALLWFIAGALTAIWSLNGVELPLAPG